MTETPLVHVAAREEPTLASPTLVLAVPRHHYRTERLRTLPPEQGHRSVFSHQTPDFTVKDGERKKEASGGWGRRESVSIVR